MVRKSSAPEIIQNCTLSPRIHPGSLTARFSTENFQFLDHLFIHSHNRINCERILWSGDQLEETLKQWSRLDSMRPEFDELAPEFRTAW